ncbi:MAG: RteC domain-containing protein, partial [Flavobacteriaceae bacterium]|nr:RteC domain-containing protein [Flavobacteriaceae bacterium]
YVFVKHRKTIFYFLMKWAIFEAFIDRDGKTRICSDLFMCLNFLSMKRTLHKSELEIRIAEIESSTPSTIDAAMEIIALCRTRLWELRDKVTDQVFLDDREEIEFFKCTKQIPMVNLIYYTEVLDFELNCPATDLEALRKLVKAKSKKWNAFFRMHADFIKYMKLRLDHFDAQFFTRKYVEDYFGKYKPSYMLDPRFNTSHDRLWARIQAGQLTMLYMRDRLASTINSNETSDLYWTSSKVSLTELVYALYMSGAINHGEADIKQIARAFEHMFNFSLGDCYRTYIEICARKKDRAKFLDELSYRLSQHIEKGDA